MTQQNWKPLSRTPTTTVTKILRNHAFSHSRERSGTIIESSEELRELANLVDELDRASEPLAAVEDRVVGAVRFLRARADLLDDATAPAPDGPDAPDPRNTDATSAKVATRERLLVAALDYLVTPVDLVPDFKAGGYIDDVFLLVWVFGVATNELEPYLTDDREGGEAAPTETWP